MKRQIDIERQKIDRHETRVRERRRNRVTKKQIVEETKYKETERGKERLSHKETQIERVKLIKGSS